MSVRRETKAMMLVGSGAVDGAWQPVISALRETAFPSIETVDGANFAMARLVYLARLLYSPLSKSVQQEQYRSDETEMKIEIMMRVIREAISKNLFMAQRQGTIRVREQFREVLEFSFGNATEIAVVTTNWDHTVAKAVREAYRYDTQYLHGRFDSPGTLYLPSEVFNEPYRNEAECKQMGSFHAVLRRELSRTDRLVLYGLALSPLDAELGQLIAGGAQDSNLQEVVIIDPCYVRVKERLGTLLYPQKTSVEVKCYLPDDLSRPQPAT